MKTKLEIAKEIITDQIVVRLEKMIEDKSIYEEYVNYGCDYYRSFDRWENDPLVDKGVIEDILERGYVWEYFWEKYEEETYEDDLERYKKEMGIEGEYETDEDFYDWRGDCNDSFGVSYIFIDRLLREVLETFYFDEDYDVRFDKNNFVEYYSSDRIDYIVSKKGEWRDSRLNRILGGDGVMKNMSEEYVKVLEMESQGWKGGFHHYYYLVEVSYMGVVGTFCWTDDWGVWEYYESVSGVFDMDGSWNKEGKHKKGVYKLLYDFLYELRENPKKYSEGIKNSVVEL